MFAARPFAQPTSGLLLVVAMLKPGAETATAPASATPAASEAGSQRAGHRELRHRGP